MSPDATRSVIGRTFPAPVTRLLRAARSHARRFIGSRRLRKEVSTRDAVRLVIGSERIAPPPGWIETDLEYLDLLRPEDWQRFFSPGSIDALLAEHVWEHLTPRDGLVAARVCHEYLKPGGNLRLAVPDGLHPDPSYRDSVRIGGSGAGAHDHKVLYTYITLGQLLREAGFEVQLLEYFDEHGAFHCVDWDPRDGMVQRSRRFDERNTGGRLRYTSLIVDARKTPRS